MKTKTYNSKEVAEIFELEIVDKPLSNTIAGQLCKSSIVQTLKEAGVEAYSKGARNGYSEKDFNDVIFRSLQAMLTKQYGVSGISDLSNMTINFSKRSKNTGCSFKCKKCNFIEIILHI